MSTKAQETPDLLLKSLLPESAPCSANVGPPSHANVGISRSGPWPAVHGRQLLPGALSTGTAENRPREPGGTSRTTPESHKFTPPTRAERSKKKENIGCPGSARWPWMNQNEPECTAPVAHVWVAAARAPRPATQGPAKFRIMLKQTPSTGTITAKMSKWRDARLAHIGSTGGWKPRKKQPEIDRPLLSKKHTKS